MQYPSSKLSSPTGQFKEEFLIGAGEFSRYLVSGKQVKCGCNCIPDPLKSHFARDLCKLQLQHRITTVGLGTYNKRTHHIGEF